MHIVAGSDIHGLLVKPEEMPQGDVLCLCGDIVPLEIQNDTIKSVSWFILDFIPWVDKLPYKKVIFVAGNHDFFLENIACGKNIQDIVLDASSVITRMLGSHKGEHKKLIYLMDNSYNFEGVRFYGTPWIADLSRWAFYKNDEELEQQYSRMPKNCDVLLTHMPPTNNDCGLVMQKGFNWMNNYGSSALSEIINGRNIKYALSGHVHSGNHRPETINGTTFVNVSIKDEDYKRCYEWFEFDI